MPVEDKRNVLWIGPPEHPGGTEITSAMVESARQRIFAARQKSGIGPDALK